MWGHSIQLDNRIFRRSLLARALDGARHSDNQCRQRQLLGYHNYRWGWDWDPLWHLRHIWKLRVRSLVQHGGPVLQDWGNPCWRRQLGSHDLFFGCVWHHLWLARWSSLANCQYWNRSVCYARNHLPYRPSRWFWGHKRLINRNAIKGWLWIVLGLNINKLFVKKVTNCLWLWMLSSGRPPINFGVVWL